MLSWGSNYPQLDDAFLRPVKQDFTSNSLQFATILFLTQVFNNSNNICKYKCR